jgi:seryl-tRNA synthetase
MLDIRYIREHRDECLERLAVRGDPALPDLIDRAIEADRVRRELIGEVEGLKAERNARSREIGERKRKGAEADDILAEMQKVAARIRALDSELTDVEEELESLLLLIPNLPDPRVPPGREGEGEIVRTWGDPSARDGRFEAHWTIGERLGLLDLERGAKLTGSGFPLFVGQGARLQRALIQLMLDTHVSEHGYTELAPPYLVNRDSMTATGHLPKFEADAYRTDPDDLFLVPTAEVPVTNLYRGEILDGEILPLAYVAYTPCFRREAGAAGKDTRGLLRVHQFDKVELVRFVEPARSEEELEVLTGHAERVLELLELPYRRALLPGGDLGFANAMTYDLEAWAPGVEAWLEVSSCSNYGDYQARRANIRFRPGPAERPLYAHTLNGSGLALARIIVALLENHQRPDGSVDLPAALRPYMGVDRLES